MNNLLKKAQESGIELEILKTEERNIELEILNDSLEKNIVSNKNNYHIKAIYKNKMITMNVDDINDVEMIIKKIKENCEILQNKLVGSLAETSTLKINKDNEKIDYEEVKKQFFSLYKLKDKYSEIDTIQSSYSHQVEEIYLKNTNGASLEEGNSIHIYLIEIIVKKQTRMETSYKIIYSKNLDFKKIKKEAEKLVKEALDKLNATSCPSQKYNVLLQNNCVKNLLDTFLPMFFAEKISKKTSILSDYYGKKVFSEKITIVEDPINKEMLTTRHFDNEGTLTTFKTIVDHGKFVTKLYDNREAEKDNTKSTGNSFGVLNMYIKPGDKSFDTLISEMINGIMIDEISGLHSGVNQITGEISVQATGYLVENSKKVKPLKLIILATNLFELLNNVKEVGNDLEFFDIYGGSPSLLLENITIVGDENE